MSAGTKRDLDAIRETVRRHREMRLEMSGLMLEEAETLIEALDAARFQRQPAQVSLRQWAIERLLAMPGAEALLRPGWVVVEPVGAMQECTGPGGLMINPPRMTLVPPTIFSVADKLALYVSTGLWNDADEVDDAAQAQEG